MTILHLLNSAEVDVIDCTWKNIRFRFIMCLNFVQKWRWIRRQSHEEIEAQTTILAERPCSDCISVERTAGTPQTPPEGGKGLVVERMAGEGLAWSDPQYRKTGTSRPCIRRVNYSGGSRVFA